MVDFQPRGRQEFLQHVADQQRGYEFSSPSYSLDDLPSVQRQARFQPTAHRSEEGLESNSPEPTSEESVGPVLVDVTPILRGPGRSHLPVLCPDREGNDIW